MAGTYYRKHMDETGIKGIYLGQAEDRTFLTKVSTTKSDLFDVGDVVVLPDGREFRYAKSTGSNILYPNMAVNFTYTGYTSYTAFAVAAAVGERSVTVPAATHAALTKDELKGGYIIIFNGSGTGDAVYEIVANDAADANALFKVELDMPVHIAVVAATSACETYKNPWNALDRGNTQVLARAGAPVSYVSAAANYFWVQTKGVKFISPQSGVGAAKGGMLTYWRHDGSIESNDTALGVTTATYDTSQPAGTIVTGSAAGNGPLINLIGM